MRSTEPDPMIVIIKDRLDMIVAKTLRVGRRRRQQKDLPGVRIIHTHPMIVRSDPDPTLAVLEERIDKIGMDHIAIVNKALPDFVKPVKTAAPGCDPDI